MITLQLDPACQLCDQFKEDINKSMVVIYGDFEEKKQIFECTITCKHRAVCRLLNRRKRMGKLNFNFRKNDRVLHYKTDGTVENTEFSISDDNHTVTSTGASAAIHFEMLVRQDKSERFLSGRSPSDLRPDEVKSFLNSIYGCRKAIITNQCGGDMQ